MDSEEFREHGKNMVDYICNYSDTVCERDVTPSIDPGYLKKLIPDEAPQEGEDFNQILEDVDTKIMPGIVHWNHPNFFAYFPAGNSFPAVLGDMLSSAIGSIGFSWASCPAATELETIVLDWYAKALDLPKTFLSDYPGSRGGGALQGSASECALVCLIAARARAIKELRGNDTEIHESVYLPKLMAYASKEAHSSIEKAAKMALVKLKIIDVDSNGRMRVDLLQASIQNDINMGLTPFFVVATVGTTGACAFDDLTEIGKVCRETPSIWFHVDGAYAGNSFILPEMRHFSVGLKYADSFNTNPNKLLLTSFDASALWVKNVMTLKTALTVNPLYLQHEHSKAIDYRHYGIPLSRRFRALKLWFVFRSYGIRGIQRYIRNHMALAKKFEILVSKDERFEVRNDVYLGLVCFRLRASDDINHELLGHINHSGKLHVIPAMVNGKFSIRFCITYEHATEQHVIDAWQEIKSYVDDVLPLEDKLRLAAELKEKESLSRKNSDTCNARRKYTRSKSMRFSFTRSISKEMYENQADHLTDGCTPILVVNREQLEKSFSDAQLTNGNGKLREIQDVDSADEISN